jgi:hypothetical protein
VSPHVLPWVASDRGVGWRDHPDRLIGIPRGSKTTRRVSGFRGSAASSGEIMGCLVVGRSFGLHVSEVAAGMSSFSAAMRGLGKEASDYPRLLCGRQLAAKATPAPRSVRESVVRLPPLAFIRRPGESLLSPFLEVRNICLWRGSPTCLTRLTAHSENKDVANPLVHRPAVGLCAVGGLRARPPHEAAH